MSKNINTEIKAGVSSNMLDKVTRLFDAQPVTVFGELLQNARRAGATQVHLSVRAGAVDGSVVMLLQDDGKGIEDPALLLQLSESGWSSDVMSAEDPAGMGLFSLSCFDHVRVFSDDWTAAIRRDVFEGKTTARVESTEGMLIDGEKNWRSTAIGWAWDIASIGETVGAFRHAARFCEIPTVTLSTPETEHQQRDKQVRVRDFMEGCTHVRQYEDDGFSIGISPDVRNDDGVKRQAVYVNFKGVTLNWYLGSAFCRNVLPYDKHHAVLINVEHSKVLQLVIPARNALVRGASTTILDRAIEERVAAWAATEYKEKHALSYASYEKITGFGYALPESTPDGRPVHESAVSSTVDPAKMLHISSIWCPDMFGSLWYNSGATIASPYDTYHLYYENNSCGGYKWYDDIPTIEELTAVVDSKEFTFEKLFEYQEEQELLQWADVLQVTAHLDNGKKILIDQPDVLVVGSVETSATFSNSTERAGVVIYLNRAESGRPEFINDVVAVLLETFYCDDGMEEDSADDSQDDFDRDARTTLLSFCKTPLDSARYLLRDFLRGTPDGLEVPSLVWSAGFDGRKNTTFAEVNYLESADTKIYADEALEFVRGFAMAPDSEHHDRAVEILALRGETAGGAGC